MLTLVVGMFLGSGVFLKRGMATASVAMAPGRPVTAERSEESPVPVEILRFAQDDSGRMTQA